MECAACGHVNPTGAVYCCECGSPATTESDQSQDSSSRERIHTSGQLQSDTPSSDSTGNSPSLTVVRGGSKGRVFPIEEGSNLIGRWDPDAGAFPEIDLEAEDLEAKVSRKHAVRECRDGTCTLEDVGSLNGTFVNRGARLEPGDRQTLKGGDEVIVGKTFLRFEL